MIEIPPGAKLIITNTGHNGIYFDTSDEGVVVSYNDFYKLKDGTLVIMDRMWDERWETEKA